VRVVYSAPPMIDEIDAVFGVKGKPIIFAWGDRIYNPMAVDVRPELLAHERVHGDRQKLLHVDLATAVEIWWRRYLFDRDWRLAEEIPAHRAEYDRLVEIHGNNRNVRRQCLAHVALKLAAPLYGKLITVTAAKKAILASEPV